VRSGRAEDAERSHPKGVIVFLGDTLRRDHLQPYGYERDNAPTLARLASEGVIFSEATSQGVWTKASVPSILASAYPATSGVRDFTDRIPASSVTLAEALRAAGYATFATSSVPFSGQLSNLQQGVEQLHESASIKDDLDGNKSARPYTDRMLDWVEMHRDVPFFVFLHAMDPHSPYEPRAPFNATWFDPDGREQFLTDMESVKEKIVNPMMQRFGMPTEGEIAAAGVDPDRYVANEKDWYDGSILGMDAEIERIIGRLEELGLADDVLFVFMSDHGEEFLDHGRHWHGMNAYAENTGVPLIMWGPGRVPAGISIDSVVQSLDVLPTVLDLAGFDIPETAQGQSMVPLMRAAEGNDSAAELGWENRPAISERYIHSSMGPGLGEQFNFYSMLTDEWKLVRKMTIEGETVTHELYDPASDPLDQNDVAAEHPEVVDRMVAQLDSWLAWAEENKLVSDADAAAGMSSEELERLRSLGYVQ
jgi:arylsulfatase A-like enzyme